MAYRIPTSPSQEGDISALVQDLLDIKEVQERIEEIVEVFASSYVKGHKSYDKQYAYVRSTQWIKQFDDTLRMAFNYLVYHKR
jgi:hypothetical protein